MDFIPSNQKDVAEMLSKAGVSDFDGLFANVPAKLGRDLALGDPLSEKEVFDTLKGLASKNQALKSFRGAGSYAHYIPAVVNHLLLRGEFYTAYTPYQAELSQGTLQAIYEFQSIVCALTGMDVANASMYDGSTALAESMFLAASEKKKKKIAIANPLNPRYMRVLKTYAWAHGLELVQAPDAETAAVIVQNPAFNGEVEDLQHWREVADKAGALLIVAVLEPTSLALLQPPGIWADLVVGEMQAFGNSVSFGGPGVGFFAAKEALMKKMPGRLCGMTVDEKGRSGFVLTLQAREQHIRREKATSNICSNEALCALAAVISISALGPKGLRDEAVISYSLAHSLQQKLAGKGFNLSISKPFYNEFLTSPPTPPSKLNATLAQNGFLGGLPLGDKWLLCCTELLSEKDLQEFCGLI